MVILMAMLMMTVMVILMILMAMLMKALVATASFRLINLVELGGDENNCIRLGIPVWIS